MTHATTESMSAIRQAEHANAALMRMAELNNGLDAPLTFVEDVQALFERFFAVIGEDPASDNGPEVWQYMGTVSDHHQFRHRMHPVLGRRLYLAIADRPAPVVGG